MFKCNHQEFLSDIGVESGGSSKLSAEIAMVNQEQLNSLEKRLTGMIKENTDRAEQKEKELLNKISNLEIANEKLHDKLTDQHKIILDTIKAWIDGLTTSITNANKEISVLAYRMDTEEERLVKERETEPLNVWTTTSGRTVEQIDKAVSALSLELGELKLVSGGSREARANKVGAWADENTKWGDTSSSGKDGDTQNNGGVNSSAKRDEDIKSIGGGLLTDITHRVDRLEDYTRRDNLIFYGIPESDGVENWTHCEEKVVDMIAKHKLLDIEEPIEFVRVHRLGRPKSNTTRPIIAKFAKFKIKDNIIRNATKIPKESTFKLSEDFCSNTNEERKKLLDFGKNAKNRTSVPIFKYHVNYKTLNIITDSKSRYTFSLDYIQRHPSSWHNTITE